MRTLKRFGIITLLAIAAPAHADAPKTLRHLVEELAVSFPRDELRACAATHPEQAERFDASAMRFSERIHGLLNDMAAVQPALSEPVPAEFLDFQATLAAQDDTGFRTRTLQECLNRIQEFEALQDAELKAGMTQTAESLSGTIRQYRKDMGRVLGTEPSA